MRNYKKDQIYAIKQNKINDFVFDEKVADVFSDMIHRSVPGYNALNQLLPIIANRFIQPNTNVYDLGCSLGEASFGIAKAIQFDSVKIIAVDNSQAMINELTETLATLNINTKIDPICADIVEIDIQSASFVVLNYTLQFINQILRDDFITKIFSRLHKKGALLLTEKVAYKNADEDALIRQLHENYKRDHKYTDLEISQKREALENVLVRDTHDQHIKRLSQAGFSKVFILARCLNFVTYIAVK